MKHLKKILSVLLIISLMMLASIFHFSCEEEIPDPTIYFHYTVPVLLKTQVIDFQLRKVVFSLDIAVIKGSSYVDSINTVKNLQNKYFKFFDYVFKNSKVHFELNNLVSRDTTPFTTFYNLLLIDQSSTQNSYETRDPYNYRYENINAFMKHLKGNGNVMLGACARDGNPEINNIKFYGNNFTNSWNKEISKNLLDLTHKTGGTSCVLDALYESVKYMADNSPDSNRSVTLFIINKDDGKSKYSADDIKNLALSENVRINLIFLSTTNDLVDFRTMLRLANTTGGFVLAGGIWALSASFFKMNEILKRQLDFYRLNVSMTIESPNYFNSGYLDVMQITYDTSKYNSNSVYFLLDTP